MKNSFQTSKFSAVSIILPVMTETVSLEQTIQQIEQDCAADVGEYLMVVCDRSSPESLVVCEKYQSQNPQRYRIIRQKLKFLGGAIRDAFTQVRCSHVIMMASDLETDPRDVVTMVAIAKQKPNAIITASRWIDGGSFKGYNPLKLLLNKVFQKFFSLLYRQNLSDMTYGYRLFPAALVQSISWEELRHPFLFETLLKPLRLGVEVVEIASKWQARSEGESQNTFFRNFAYFGIGLRVLKYDRQQILKGET